VINPSYPERLRQQFEGVIQRFKTGGQWRGMPQEFGPCSTVPNRFRQWRDAGVFEALGLIAKGPWVEARPAHQFLAGRFWRASGWSDGVPGIPTPCHPDSLVALVDDWGEP
jgi:Transposase and inactivated derivatives